MGNDLGSELSDRGRRDVIGINTHSACKDQKISTVIHMLLRCVHDHIDIIVTDRHSNDLTRIFCELHANHRLKFVLDATAVHL